MKKSTKIIIAVVAVIVVAAAVVATLFLTGVIGKTNNPKKAFYEILNKSSDEKVNYEEMISNLKKSQEQQFSGKGTMTMNVELGGELSEYKEIAEILNNVEIAYNSKSDPKNSNTYAEVNVKYDGKDLGKFEMITDKDTVGVKFDEIYDKYITMSMDDLMGNTGNSASLKNISSTIEDIDIDEVISILEISNSEISRIKERYLKVLEDAIPEERYSSEKEKITVCGKEINATGYSVEISDEDFANVISKILESLKDDEETIELLVSKVNSIMELSGESTKITKSQVKILINSLSSSLARSASFSGEKVKITVYENKNKIVRVKFGLEENSVSVDTLKDGDTTNMELKLNYSGKEMTLLKASETKKGDNKYTSTMSVDIEGVKLDVTMDTESSDEKVVSNMKLHIELQDTIKATLNIEAEANFESVSIEKLTTKNSISNDRLTSNDNKEISANVGKYLEKNKDVINDITGLLGVENTITSKTEQTNKVKLDIDENDDEDDLDEDEDDDVA